MAARTADYSGPTVYAEWLISGNDSGFQFYTGYSLNTNSNYIFTVEDYGHDYIWRFYVDGQSSPFMYSPTTNLNTGWSVANSERHNDCDSLYTHMYDLNYYTSSQHWSVSYGDLECWTNSSVSNPYYLHKDSNSEFDVTTNSSGALC